jgi:PBP1b-binding outer membrane lipoprotein LpoB
MIALVGALAVVLGGCSKTEEPKEEPKAPEAVEVVAPAPEATPVAPAAETAVAPADPAAAQAPEAEKKDPAQATTAK